jgi:hypothetical protein
MKLLLLFIVSFFCLDSSLAQINLKDLKGEWVNEDNNHRFYIKIKKGVLEVFECGGRFKTGYSESLEVKGDSLFAAMNCRGEVIVEYTLVFVNSDSMILKGNTDKLFRKKSVNSRIYCP